MGGLLLEPDTSPYLTTTLTVENDIDNDVLFTKASTNYWEQHYSYGLDLGSNTSITGLSVSCVIDEEGTPLTPIGWDSAGDAFSVYGAFDGAASTWALIESFVAPTQTYTGSGELTFNIVFAVPTAAYRYYKVVATEASGCLVTVASGSPVATIGEIDAVEGLFKLDSIIIAESVTISELRKDVNPSGDSVTITESVSIVREVPKLPSASDSLTVSESVALLIPIVGHGAIDFPEFILEGYGGATGAIDFPEFELAGTGYVGVVGAGAIDFPEFELEGYGGGSGAIDFPEFVVEGTGMVSIIGHGAINFPGFELDGTGSISGGHGAIYFPQFELSGEGIVGIVGKGAILFPYPQLEGEGYVGAFGEGAIVFPEFELDGAGHVTGEGEGAIDFPEFILSGSGYVGDLHDDTILQHQRDERFIT